MQLTRLSSFFNRIKRQLLSRVYLARALLLVVAIVLITGTVFVLRAPANLTYQLIRAVASSSIPNHAGRTNFLILGIGGENHQGSDLTDSIIFLSVSRYSQPTVMLSIPRDLWVPSMRAKINSTYHYGRVKAGTSGGLLLAKSSVSEILGEPVDFAVVFDFATFAQIIDTLGGINVQIEKSFVDDRYPIAGRETDLCEGDVDYKCRYETISFDQGLLHMDGSTALKYVRSRYSADLTEGTDFARSRRQSQVISAIKAKLFSQGILTKPAVYRQIATILLTQTTTDITSDQYIALSRLAISARKNPQTTTALIEPDHIYHPPVSPKYDNQWVLVPKGDDPHAIYDFVSSLLK